MDTTLSLAPRRTQGATVTSDGENGWRLAIPSGQAGVYRLAQLDDYMALSRSAFPWNPPMTLSLRARVSAESLPGTWGFGLWNDPFGFALGFGGTARRLPALPNAAWFFYASASNYLSLRDDLPANGFLAATFQSPRSPGSPRWSSLILAPGLLGLPLLVVRPMARWIRRLLSQIIRQDTTALSRLPGLSLDVTQWHSYRLEWYENRVFFRVDKMPMLETVLAPRGPLGLVLWIDNQYAAFTPEGKIAYGLLENPSLAWLELTNIEMTRYI